MKQFSISVAIMVNKIEYKIAFPKKSIHFLSYFPHPSSIINHHLYRLFVVYSNSINIRYYDMNSEKDQTKENVLPFKLIEIDNHYFSFLFPNQFFKQFTSNGSLQKASQWNMTIKIEDKIKNRNCYWKITSSKYSFNNDTFVLDFGCLRRLENPSHPGKDKHRNH